MIALNRLTFLWREMRIIIRDHCLRNWHFHVVKVHIDNNHAIFRFSLHQLIVTTTTICYRWFCCGSGIGSGGDISCIQSTDKWQGAKILCLFRACWHWNEQKFILSNAIVEIESEQYVSLFKISILFPTIISTSTSGFGYSNREAAYQL